MFIAVIDSCNNILQNRNSFINDKNILSVVDGKEKKNIPKLMSGTYRSLLSLYFFEKTSQFRHAFSRPIWAEGEVRPVAAAGSARALRGLGGIRRVDRVKTSYTY